MGFKYEYYDEFSGDMYRYTCDTCGWFTLVPEGADVACCPKCESAAEEALYEAIEEEA